MMLPLSRLLAARRKVEALMQTAVVVRRSGQPVRDPETGTLTPSLTVIYEGVARLRFPVGKPRDVDQAGQAVSEQSPTLWLPVAESEDVLPGDVGEIVANPADPGSVGLRFRITGVHVQTHSTSRRLPVEVLSYA